MALNELSRESCYSIIELTFEVYTDTLFYNMKSPAATAPTKPSPALAFTSPAPAAAVPLVAEADPVTDPDEVPVEEVPVALALPVTDADAVAAALILSNPAVMVTGRKLISVPLSVVVCTPGSFAAEPPKLSVHTALVPSEVYSVHS